MRHSLRFLQKNREKKHKNMSSLLSPPPPLHVTVLTLFPDMFPGPLEFSLLGDALKKNLWTLNVVNIREFTLDKHQTVDEPGFGGGPGMVMRADVLDRALQALVQPEARPRLIYLSPRGTLLRQTLCRTWQEEARPLILLCGRFEGVDQRLLDFWQFEEVSLGDFVLTGGEIAAMALIDSCVRLMEGVIGDPASLEEESFSAGLLEYPHYTRPRVWQGLEVPAVLLSGHHAQIHQWRHQQAEAVTQQRRPDLWTQYQQACYEEEK